MLDGVSLDHLRIFVAVADVGSFSAAARRIGRTQSAVSQAIASLEGQLDVSLFERSGRTPVLTPHAKALLIRARNVVRGADTLKAEARALAAGLEPHLSIAIDVMFPQTILTEVAKAFARTFATTALHVHVEVLGAVPELVLSGHCRIGLMGPMPVMPTELETLRLLSVEMATVVAPTHPLSIAQGKCHPFELRNHVQLVLSDRSSLTDGRDFGVFGDATWRMTDLSTKHAFLLAGLGWGHMPLPRVKEDLQTGRLVRIDVDIGLGPVPALPMLAVYRRDKLPGPAGRWLIDRLSKAGSDGNDYTRWPEAL